MSSDIQTLGIGKTNLTTKNSRRLGKWLLKPTHSKERTSVNQDFFDLLQALNQHEVRFLIVGGYAVIKHSEPRYTKDLDVWIASDFENAGRVVAALTDFGAPLGELTAKDFTAKDFYFTIGIAPNRIDIWFDLPGVEFENCWQNRVTGNIGELEVSFISREDLIKNKQAVGRLQDLADVEKLIDTK
jgi:hypothetical protein